MTYPTTLTNPAQANAPTVVNANLSAIAIMASYAYKSATTSGLTLGYFGTHIAGTTIADGTIALTLSATNYVVAHRTTGAVTAATNTTNWSNTGTYGRVGIGTTSASAITAWVDWRHQEGGWFDRTGSVNALADLTDVDIAGSPSPADGDRLVYEASTGKWVAAPASAAASAISVSDSGAYYAGSDVEAVLQEVGASLAAAGKVPAQRYTIELLDTTDSDPGAGLVKFNNATPASATQLYIDDSTSDGVDLSTFFASLPATGFSKIQSVADAGEWVIFKWTATVDGTGYWKFTVVAQASKGTLDDADAVLIEFDSDANTGSGGTELKGLTFTSDTGSTADSDPGAGLFKWNNATQGSSTKLFFDNATLDTITITAFFATLSADSTVYIQQGDDATKWQLWEIDTATADTGYYDFAVTLLAKSTADIADDKTCYCDFKKGAASSSTQGRHAVFIAAGSMAPSVSGGCASLTRVASAANQPDIASLDFDTTTQEYAQFSWTMPKSWNEGTVTFAPIWSHAATTTNFGVVFDLQGYAASNDDAIATAFGTAQTSTDTGGTTNDLYMGPESSAITIAGTPAAEDTVFFRISRVTGDGGDTMAIDARLMGIVLYITTNADTDA